MAGTETLTGIDLMRRANRMLVSQVNSPLPPRELFQRANSWSKVPREVSIFTENRDSLIASVTGPMRSGIYLEVGFGVKPYYQATSRKFSQESPYIGVDGQGADGYTFSGDQIVQNAARNAQRLQGTELPQSVALLVGDGRSVQLPRGSAQEIFMGDVLLDTFMKSAAMYDLITEARRLLNPETGVLVIRESNLSNIKLDGTESSEFERMALGELGFALDLAGFERIILDETDGPPCEAIAQQFGETAQGKKFIIAKPQKLQSVLETPMPRITRRT